MHAAAFTLLVSTFFVVAYNTTFWRTFVQATGSLSLAHLPLHLASFLLIVVLFNAFLTLINFRYVLKPVLVVLFIATAATSYFMNHFGTQIDRSMVQNLFETDVREASELLNLQLVATIGLLGILPSLAVWRVKLTYPGWRRDLLHKTGIVSLSALVAAALLFGFFKSLAPALREHRELRFLLTPTNYIQAVHSYFKQKDARPLAVAPLGLDAVRHVQGEGQRSVTIIVVGETARAQNFSLNGYARQTNPELAAQPGLINFTHVESCGTATAVSLPCVFSALGRDDYSDSKAHSQEGLLDVLAHAGFKVLWRDNNSGCKGACDRVAYEDLSQPQPGNQFCVGDECYDERLLERLPEIIRASKDDLVIVLHQKGSHGPAYDKRYPAAFRRFTPVCQTTELEQCSRESIVAAYDNTILYTDHFLNRTIELLKKTAAEERLNTAMMYFSDHGESLGEKNMYLHGAPYMLAPIEQRSVPMMLWLSDGYATRYHIDQRCLGARAGQPFSHDNVFHSVLGMLSVGTAVYNPHLDIFSPCRNHD
ncbi:MAG: phosphoethanolamine transferase [Gammaproteobacteria bacterium]